MDFVKKLDASFVQKSFYGKANVYKENDTTYLKSYDTFVLSSNEKDGYKKLWNGYSVTTMNHVRAFVNELTGEIANKKWWDSLPLDCDEKQYRVVFHGIMGMEHKKSFRGTYEQCESVAQKLNNPFWFAEIIEA